MGLDPYLRMGRGIKEDVDTTPISRGDYETGRYSDLGDDTDIEVDGDLAIWGTTPTSLLSPPQRKKKVTA